MNDLDQMLDNAVKSYAAVDPSPDFELRVLARVRQLEKPRASRWPWVVGFSVATAALFTFVAVQRIMLPQPPGAIAVASPKPPTILMRPFLSAAVPSGNRSERRMRRSMTRPLTMSYSPAELATLKFAKEHPEEAAQVAKLEERDDAVSANPLHDARIEIAPIQIPPITIPAIHEENEP